MASLNCWPEVNAKEEQMTGEAVPTLTLQHTLFCQLLTHKLCLGHHLVHSCDPGHCLTLLGGTRSAGGRGKIKEFREKILSTSGSVVV